MKALEIESWALRVLESVGNHQPVEDSKVELKADWPADPVKAARRIAGHANAARGESILWLIGADEKQGVITGANYQDLASWFPQVRACFESEVPRLQDLSVICGGKTVAALCFDTSRFPFVIKNPKGGEIQFEVPWRDGTGVRTATRDDLVLMLSPLLRTPKLEIMRGDIDTLSSGSKSIRFTLVLYAVPVSNDPIVFPFHRCKACLKVGNETKADAVQVAMNSPQAKREFRSSQFRKQAKMMGGSWVAPEQEATLKTNHDAIEATESEVVIRGCGKVELDGSFNVQPDDNWPELQIHVTLSEAVSETSLGLTARFVKAHPWVWIFAK